jgi:transcriptional regulator with XRE-family HTH domain
MQNSSRELNAIDLEVAELIKKQREELKMTQEEVAKKLKITSQQYQKYESAINRLSFGRAVDLSRIIGDDFVLHFFLTVKEKREMKIGRAVEKILKNN